LPSDNIPVDQVEFPNEGVLNDNIDPIISDTPQVNR